MNEKLNENIQFNLELIYDSDKRQMLYDQIKNIDNSKKEVDEEKRLFAELLEKEGLIKMFKELCILQKKGIDIIESGGYIKYLEKEKSKESWKHSQIKFDVISKPLLILIALGSLALSIWIYYNNKSLEQRIEKLEKHIVPFAIKK